MINVSELLEYLQSCGLVRLNKVVGDYYSMYCPFHSDGKESRPSSGMLMHDQYKNGKFTEAGFFHCFTCSKALSVHQFVSELFKLHTVTSEIREHVQSIIGERIESNSGKLFSESYLKSVEARFAVNNVKQILNKKLTYVSDEELQKYRFTVPYMYERKLTDELIEQYDVGVDMHYIPKGGKKEIPCITFPVRNIKGETLFIVRRAISIKRFYVPSDVEKPVYGLYELPKGCKSVVVVESCFNALTSTRYGKPAVALLGTGTPYQIEQLKRLGVNEFIFGFDPDEAGDRATRKLSRALKNVALCWSFSGIPEGKDINDLSEDEFNSLEII